MTKTFALSLAAASLALSAPAQAWGPTGHRVTSEIAEANISGRTRAEIRRILGHESLAEAGTWSDEQRSNPLDFWQQEAGPYHYVTLPEGRSIEQLEHPPEGDAATALERFSAVLRDPGASQEDKALALRFIVHIVSDLHMPLHVGNGSDRGGNDPAPAAFLQRVHRTAANPHRAGGNLAVVGCQSRHMDGRKRGFA